jgi:hypothetical protein
MTKVNKLTLLRHRIKNKIISKVLHRLKEDTEVDNISEQLYTKDCVKEHYYTFQLKEELFTILYTCLAFKWFQADRVK